MIFCLNETNFQNASSSDIMDDMPKTEERIRSKDCYESLFCTLKTQQRLAVEPKTKSGHGIADIDLIEVVNLMPKDF